jgi:hypothetical protein
MQIKTLFKYAEKALHPPLYAVQHGARVLACRFVGRQCTFGDAPVDITSSSVIYTPTRTTHIVQVASVSPILPLLLCLGLFICAILTCVHIVTCFPECGYGHAMQEATEDSSEKRRKGFMAGFEVTSTSLLLDLTLTHLPEPCQYLRPGLPRCILHPRRSIQPPRFSQHQFSSLAFSPCLSCAVREYCFEESSSRLFGPGLAFSAVRHPPSRCRHSQSSGLFLRCGR